MSFHSFSRAMSFLRPTNAILAGRSLAVSPITLAGIEYGMEARNWGTRRRELMRRFLSRFTPLPPDKETANEWTRIKSERDRKGRPISFPDAWIAAAAVQPNIPVVTHNAGDYAAIEGLTILSASTVA
jgi:predicted nucleic acid-binding protein